METNGKTFAYLVAICGLGFGTVHFLDVPTRPGVQNSPYENTAPYAAPIDSSAAADSLHIDELADQAQDIYRK